MLVKVAIGDIYASIKWLNIVLDNGMSPVKHNAITWTNRHLLPIRQLEGAHFSEIWIQITRTFIQENAFECFLQNGSHYIGIDVQQDYSTHSLYNYQCHFSRLVGCKAI